VNMVRHHYPGMQLVIAVRASANPVSQDLSDGCYPQVCGARAVLIEQPVHADECPSRVHPPAAKLPARRQTAVQAKGDEERLSHAIPMREATPENLHSSISDPRWAEILTLGWEFGGLKPAAG